jgi:uncharacterized protein (DUF302 family)
VCAKERWLQEVSSTVSNYVFSVITRGPFEDAVRRATEALRAEGFGVLTTIDVARTLSEKLGVERPPYVILGACNPRYAHAALEADPDIGALLPCNVVLRARDDARIDVVFMDPRAVLGFVTRPEVSGLAEEVRAKLERVASALARD